MIETLLKNMGVAETNSAAWGFLNKLGDFRLSNGIHMLVNVLNRLIISYVHSWR